MNNDPHNGTRSAPGRRGDPASPADFHPATGPAAEDDAEAIERAVMREQVRSLFGSLWISMSVVPIVVVVIVHTLWPGVSHTALLVWGGVIVVLAVIRWWQWDFYRRSDPETLDPEHWRRFFVIGSTIHSAAVGSASLVVFPADDVVLQALLAVVMVGVASGGVLTLLAHLPSAALHTIVVLGPLAWRFLLTPAFPATYAGLTVIYIAMLIFVARDVNGILIRSLRGRIERGRLADTLAIATREAEAANHAKSLFLANMSHELRTPLNAILGFAQVIKVQYFGPDAQDKYVEYAADIERGGQHLLNIIDDILDLSKIEAGKMTLEETEVDIAEVVDECISMVSVRAQGASLKLDRHLAAGLPMVLADRRALKQILLNLIGNAIKFTPPGGRITVALSRRDDGELELSVSDTGIGIAAEQIDLIFMPFNQADVSWSRRIQGTGLGLPLTRELVELHGGRIELDSVVDVGTTVTITLPAARLLD